MPSTIFYPFANARPGQEDRLAGLEALLDPGTTRHLQALGVRRGHECLEVGAGRGSIALWMAERVGAEGAVLATDLDPDLAARVQHPSLDVIRHDLTVDPLPVEAFDVIHARLLIAWLPDPQDALRRLAGALKPGGVLLCEEMDFGSVAVDPRCDPAASAAFERCVAAHDIADETLDCAYGRRLAGDLTDAGLVGVGAEGRSGQWRGGEAGGMVWRTAFEQLRDELVATGRATADDVETAIRALDDPGFAFLSQVTVAAWGRRLQ